MADVHVWEEDEVDCRASFFGGIFSKVTACKFNFYESPTNKVGSVDGTLTGGTRKTATAKYKTRKCKDDEEFYNLVYRLEVDGKERSGSAVKVFVWAKIVTIEAKDKDGKAVEDCGFTIAQTNPRPKKGAPVETSVDLKTDPQGKIEHELSFGAPFFAKVLSPHYKRVPTVDVKPRKKTYTVAKGFKATLAFPPAGDHIQWVNLPKDGAKPAQGHKIKLKATPEDPTQAAEGDFVFWKVTFTPIGCGREEPSSRGFALTASGDHYTAKTTLDASKETTLEIDLGHAGGDECLVSVGGTPDANDEEVKIVNWRKLFYEIVAPVDMALEDVTLDDGSAAKGFPATITDWAAERLDAAFVKYVQVGTHRFDDTDAKLGGTMFPSELVEKPAGTKVCLYGKWPPDSDKFTSTGNITVKVTAVDYALKKADDYRPKLQLEADSIELDVYDEYGDYTFEKSMGTTSEGGGTDCTVKNATWTAVVDKKAYPNHPGLDGTKKPKTGAITVDGTTFEWLTWKKIKITLPAAAKLLVGAASDAKCPIQVKFDLQTAGMINGSAGSGFQKLVFGRPPKPIAATMCHELGHSMGQTVFPTGNRKKKPAKGMAYPKTIPKGDKYDDSWGHAGSHCANGLSAKDKKKPSPGSLQGTCLMFGSGGDETEPARNAYCAECLKHLQARRLDDLVSSYATRADDKL
ncbi:MAG: hypothetical protein IT379_11415 [Deltaproteobacteria bacterium]|nr:hypothetical protein [Deltaproteobacteria bacterium]